jgi:hypothetical protein
VGFSVTHTLDQETGEHVVAVRVGLNVAETSALFLSGDTMVSWPEGRLRSSSTRSGGSPEGVEPAPARTGMFVSELARLAHGLEIGYRQAVEAERAAHVLRLQLLRAGFEEVS